MRSERLIRPVLLLLTAALLISTALNYLLWRKSRHYYLLVKRIQLDPVHLSHYPTQPEVSLSEKPLAVFFGDSRAYDWPAPALDGFAFANRGVPGEMSVQSLARLEQHVIALRPDIVVVQVGVNDLHTIPFMPEERSRLVANCQANLGAIVARLQGAGATVIVTTIFPVGRMPLEQRLLGAGDAGPLGEAIGEVNAFIARLEGEGVIVFDTAPVLTGGEPEPRGEYLADYLHLNAAGYAALNEALIPLLRAAVR
jgi:lysophospholipase L1-like esterase